MKKILVLVFVLGLCGLFSCNNSSQKGKRVSAEYIEWCSQFNIIDVDTANICKVNIEAFQILDENTCLARECLKNLDECYIGNVVYYVTDNILYDNIIIKEDAYFVGTYTYNTKVGNITTVQMFVNTDFYKENKEFFDIIKEINLEYN